jgi:uncharacterized protein YdaU (DUF1376 family)
MAKPIWFPFYPNDFLASSKVALLTTEEIGAYLLLLCHAWQDPQCSLPNDDEALSKLGRIKGDVTALRSCFTVKKHRLINERLYKEWIKAKEQRELASTHGKQGAMKRWTATPLATPLATPIQNHSSSPSPSPSELREKKKSSPLRATVVIDSEWITDLGQNPAYQHINLSIELGKMDAWLALPKNAKRKKTRSFVLNWLNKIEAPMSSVSGNGQRPPPPPPKNDPIGRGQWKMVYGKPEDHGYV